MNHEDPPRVVVTDIEGTTTALSFVHDTLFPFSRARLASFVAENPDDPDTVRSMDEARRTGEAEGLPAGSEGEVVALLLRWLDEDRKHPALKRLQGRIWRTGFEAGAFRGHVYPDVPGRLRAWRAGGVRLGVFSSGSVEAQRLLFGCSEAGDLSPLFERWFDTSTGPKRESAAYLSIAEAFGEDPGRIAFLSDVGAELDAARGAGMIAIQLVRPGVEPVAGHRQAADFEEAARILGLPD